MANNVLNGVLSGYSNQVDTKKLSLEIESIKIRFNNEGLNLENISILLFVLMEEVGKYKKLSGSDKKRLVIRIMNSMVDDICPGEDTELEHVLKQLVPTLIDGIIHAGKMKLFTRKICKCF